MATCLTPVILVLFTFLVPLTQNTRAAREPFANQRKLKVEDGAIRRQMVSRGVDSRSLLSVYPDSSQYTAMGPDASILTWHSKPEAGLLSTGTLNVRLDPSDLSSPSLHLEVRMRFAREQPAPHGPMLLHCGGPGSDSHCVEGSGASFDGYDVWSISQRGTGSHANPRLLCSHSHLPEKCPEGGCKISDFTDCPCALLDGTPEIGESWTDIDPKKDLQVRGLLQHMKAWGSRCYSADKFQLRGSQDRKYNFLDYVGTQFLAYDIERMRQAIGGPKMSIYGFSYGSLVGAVYATVFASHVGAVVLDGNMDPFPQKESQSLGIASENDGGVDKLLLTCQRAPERCSLKEPEQEYSEILESARAGNLTAPTKSGMSFKLTVGMLMAYLQFELRQNTGQGFPRATATLAALSPRSSDGAGRSAAVARILDGYCAVKGRPTWFHYDVCVGPGQTSEQEGTAYGEPYLEQCAVVGMDQAGTLGVRDALGFLRFFGGRYSDAGLAALVTNVASFSFWPATATPIAPIGNPYVRALVIGNLFDSSTSYEWSQRMSQAFPAGALMTWQGVGHTLPRASRSYDPEGVARCQERVTAYLSNGTLPLDGYVCVQRRPAPVGF